MPKYKVVITRTLITDITVEAPNKATLIKSISNDIKVNEDEWTWEERQQYKVNEDKELETPEFKLDNGLLIDYDVYIDEDDLEDTKNE